MKSALSLLLSPPVLLFSAMLILVIACWRKQQRTLLWLSFGLATAFYVANTPVTVNLFAWSVGLRAAPECGSPIANATVVVLTGGASGSARNARELWRLDQATFRRLVFAVEIARRAPHSELLISGGAEVGLTTEARIAEQFVLQLGWSAARLRIEDTSFDTYTSARDVAPMLDRARPLVLVTSDLHMRRAAYIFGKAAMHPIACPVPDPDALIFPDSLLPHPGSMHKFSQAWKEILGLIVYALRESPVNGTG
jgi:uncharacterized SAM-binding protein YcdF (DUF218 family)